MPRFAQIQGVRQFDVCQRNALDWNAYRINRKETEMKTTEGVVIEIKHKRKYGGVFQMMAGCDNDCGGAIPERENSSSCRGSPSGVRIQREAGGGQKLVDGFHKHNSPARYCVRRSLRVRVE